MLSTRKKEKCLLFAALLAIAGFFYLFRLGGNAFIDYDEATYAQVMQQSFSSGHYASFIRGSQNWFEKPPLYFWLSLGSSKIFGFNEFALRLPAALFGILGIIFAWLLAERLSKNQYTGFLAGLILLLTGEFVFAGRQVRMDVPVATSILSSVYFFTLGWEKPKFFLAFGASLAAAVLFKSLVGFLALPAILIFCAFYRQWRWFYEKWFWAGLALSLALLTPWHLYESLKFGWGFWNEYLGYHILKRFAQPIIGEGVGTKHYVKYLFYLIEPWFMLSAIGIVWLASRIRKVFWADFRLPLASLVSAIFIFSFFAVARTKLFYYLEPLYPFLAIFLASVWTFFLNSPTKPVWKILANLFLMISIIGGVVNVMWQAVYLRQGFANDFQVAEEEKTVSGFVEGQSLSVYVFDWSWLETLSFYSRQKIYNVPKEGLGNDSCYLIVPSQLFKFYKPSEDFARRSTLIFSGEQISLFKLSQTASP